MENVYFWYKKIRAFVAESQNPDERASVREAFAGAVLWAGDIIATENNTHLVDFSSFLIKRTDMAWPKL